MYYAQNVRDAAVRRQLISAGGEIVEEAYDSTESATIVADSAEQKIYRITQKQLTGQTREIAQIAPDVYEAVLQRKQGLCGLSTGFPALDDVMGGLRPGELTIPACRPSMGKTALGLNIAEYLAVDNDMPIAIFSLEMSEAILTERMMAGRGHIDTHRLQSGQLDTQEKQKLQTVLKELQQSKMFIHDSATLTPRDLRAKARRLRSRHGIEAVFVDYLQLMYVPKAENRIQEVSQISRELKGLALELEIPVIAMAQLNRQAEQRENHRPRLADLRESGTIEQDADVVLLIHREDYYHAGEDDYKPNHTAEIIVAKNRNGRTGSVKLTWQGCWTRFDEYVPMQEMAVV